MQRSTWDGVRYWTTLGHSETRIDTRLNMSTRRFRPPATGHRLGHGVYEILKPWGRDRLGTQTIGPAITLDTLEQTAFDMEYSTSDTSDSKRTWSTSEMESLEPARFDMDV